jgi:hypothetical protein
MNLVALIGVLSIPAAMQQTVFNSRTAHRARSIPARQATIVGFSLPTTKQKPFKTNLVEKV